MTAASVDRPARWQDVHEPMVVRVPCHDGALHTVRWTPDGVATPDHHADAEDAYVALGGEPSACSVVAEYWQGEPINVLSPRMWQAAPAWLDDHDHDPARTDAPIRRSLSSFLKSVLGDAADEFEARRSQANTVAHLLRGAIDEWLALWGAAPCTDVAIVVSQAAEGAPPDDATVDSLVEAAERPVGLWAVFGPDITTRVVAAVTEDWFEVWRHGPVSDGLLDLGHNGAFPVAASIRVSDGTWDPFAVLIAQGQAGEHLARPSVSPTDAVAHLADLRETVNPNQVAVVVENVFGYDDNNYFPEDGYTIREVLRNPVEAHTWSAWLNVASVCKTASPEHQQIMWDRDWPDGLMEIIGQCDDPVTPWLAWCAVRGQSLDELTLGDTGVVAAEVR